MARRWLIAGAAVLVVLGGAGAAAVLTFDPASQRDRITQAIRRATGRELTLAGPLRISWGLSPVLEAEDVSLANMPGGTRPQMVTMARMAARIELLPFLMGRVELASVTLVRPDILLETDASGRGNWQFDRPAASSAPAAASGSPGPRLTTQLDSVRIESGRLTWHDGVTGRTVTADVPSATADLGTGRAHLLAQATSAGANLRLDATLGTWAQLTGTVPGPWPVKLEAAIGDATLALDGTADPAARSLAGRMEASVPDLARIATLLGRPGLPPLHDVHVAATLPPGGGVPTYVTLQAGASDLGSVLAGATLAHLSLNWPSGQPARLEADGAIGAAPWHVGTGLLQAGQGVALRGLAVASSLGDLSGDLAVALEPRPALRGTLVSSRIDGDAIRAAIPSPPPALRPATPPAAPPAVPQAAPDSQRVFSTTPLPFEMLRRADADLQVTVGMLHLGGADFRNATGHLVLRNGVLHLDPASVLSPAGRVDLSASVDAAVAPPTVILVLRSAAVAVDAVVRTLGLPGGSDAVAELDVALHAAGESPHALASTLNGHVGVALVDGELSNALLTAMLGDLGKQAGAGMDPAGRSHVRCLALRADAVDGVVTLSALKLDTARLTLEGGGTVNLADETMALRLRPLLRLGGAGVSAPLRLDGPLRHPAVVLDQNSGTGRTSVVIGGLAGPADSCAPELAAARDGRSGRLPVEAAANKPGKPADLLRSLLR